MSDDLRSMRRAIAYCLLSVTIVFLLTGFGIANQPIVGPLTLGLLSKSLAFQLHDWLWIPFVALLIVHVWLALSRKS